MPFEIRRVAGRVSEKDTAEKEGDDTAAQDTGMKPEAGRPGYNIFFNRFEKTINGYFGTPDVKFTMKPGGWYVDLEKIEVNADPNFFIDKGYSQDEALFASFHEAEHFRDMIREPEEYKRLFDRMNSESTVHPALPKALHTLYNCLDDVLVNKCVMQRWNSGRKAKDTLYPKLFQSSDLMTNPFTGKEEPGHRQFMYALLREAMLPDETCTVSPYVREAIDKVQAKGGKLKLTEVLTAVDLEGEGVMKPIDRFGIISGLIEPTFIEMFKKDIETMKEQQEKSGKGGKSGEKPDGDKKGGEKTDAQPDPDAESAFDDDPFKDAIPDPIEFKDIQDQVQKIREALAKKKKEEMEKLLGVSKEDYDAYAKDFKMIQKFIADLSGTFDAVIQRRKTIERKLRKPVREGVMLSPSRIATAVAEIKSGNTDPRTMLDYEDREATRTRPSDFEFTIVCDGSGSMKGEGKDKMQRQLSVLITEALLDFQERLEKERRKGERINLNIKSEVRMFDENDHVLKPLGTTLTHKERVAMHKVLREFPGGSNNEIATFTKMREEQFDADRVEKMRKGDIKKVILWLTDGESDVNAIQSEIRRLEALTKNDSDQKSLVIAGLGFKGGQGALTTYAPNGYYGESFEKIIEIFKKFLTQLLDDL